MAEGCNLHTTKEDIKQVQNSSDKGLPSEQRKIASSLLRNIQKANLGELLNSLKDKEHPQYNLTNKLLIKSFGEGKVTAEEENKLNEALHTILKEHPDPQGLFEKPSKQRGPGSTSVDHPYEILCASALIQDQVISSSGHLLKINASDRLDLGLKSPSKNILSTAKKNTIESDILIQRGEIIIGIDAKYTNGTTYGVKPSLKRQLDGVKSALQDRDITEYHFITNVKFTNEFKKMVDNTNRELIADEIEINRQLYRGIRDIIPVPEKESISAIELASKLDFQQDREKINSLLKDRVPQIGYCEKVNYK